MSEKISNFEKSRAYRARVHDVIPGGAHTYSKGDDQFPAVAPAAITHGRGAYVWDLDGHRYLDCSMGLTSVSLGHAYQPVLDRVIDELGRGVNFQRPSVLELQTAERFIGLVHGHDMIKFAKNGSTVTTAAVKLARAKTGRPLVAFPGNHPFYSYDDWFIGKTVCSKGVPEQIAALSVTFTGCDIESLKALFAKHPGQIACVITEPAKNTCDAGCACGGNPATFIKEAIAVAHAHGALFIADEMITGFKAGWPGACAAAGLVPDMATWGKGIANGFAFCALTGTKDVMELGGIRAAGEEKVFLISTTHGAETHAMAAVLATIDEFERHSVVRANRELGGELITRAREVVASAGLSDSIAVLSCDWMVTFMFRDRTGAVCGGMRTLMQQEMIARGVLFQGVLVPCWSHKTRELDVFLDALAAALPTYAEALRDGYRHYLVGEPTKGVFRKHL